MQSTPKKPLDRRLAITLSVVVMWIVGGLGHWLLHSSQHWYFVLLNGYDAVTLGQIGSYYLARVGAQLPALGLAVIVIALSDFRHPVRTSCLTTFAFHGISTAIRLVRRPWSAMPDLDQSIPILAELAQLTLLVMFIGLIAWFFMWLTSRPSRRPVG